MYFTNLIINFINLKGKKTPLVVTDFILAMIVLFKKDLDKLVIIIQKLNLLESAKPQNKEKAGYIIKYIKPNI